MPTLARLTLVAALPILLLSFFWSIIQDAEAAPLAIPRADVALSGMTLEGPTVGLVGTSLSFTATVSPADATQPVSYRWEATGQASFEQVGGLSTTASFTWAEPGLKVITVTSENGAGTAVQRNYGVLIQEAPLDVAVVFDVSGSMDYETSCFGCWREYPVGNPNHDVVVNPFPANGATYPAHYDPFGITGTQSLYVPTSNLCTVPVSPTVRSGYFFLVHEAEYYSRNDAAGSPQGWLFNQRYPGQGFWVLQRAERGSNRAHIRAHPYVTYSQSNINDYPQLQGMSYDAECFDTTGQCWNTKGQSIGEAAPAINITVPYVEYDFTVDWSQATHIWIRAQGGSSQSFEWNGRSPSSLTSYRKAIFWKVDNLGTRGGNFNNVNDGPAELAQTNASGNISFSMNDANWRWIKLGSETLAAGQHSLRLYQGSTGFNIDKVIFTNNPWGNTGDAIPNTGTRIGSGSTSLSTYIPLRDTLQLNGGQGPDATEGSATREACNVCNPIFGGQSTTNPMVTQAMCSCKKSSTDTAVTSPIFFPAGGSGQFCSSVNTETNILENDLYHDVDPLRSAQEAVKYLITQLNSRFDQIGLVAFSGSTGSGSILAPRVKLQCLVYAQKGYVGPGGVAECYDPESDPITFTTAIRAVEDHNPNASTNTPEGMREGLEELGLKINNPTNVQSGACSNNSSVSGDGRSCDRQGNARRILVLLTDGVPNQSDNCPATGLWRGRVGQGNQYFDCSIYYAQEAAKHNVTVYTIGIGTGVNFELLMAMAEGQDPNPVSGDDGFYFNNTCGRFYLALRPLLDLKLIMEDIIIQARSCNPHLTFSKTGPAAVLAGEPITYTLTVTNEGLVPVTNLVITDAIPVGATYLTGGDQVEGEVVSWTLDSLAVGEVAQVTFAVTASQSITNTHYRVSGEGIDLSGLIPVFTEVTPAPVPVLALGKRGPAAALVGQPITYTLTVTNSGTATATNLVITDVIPVGATYLEGGTQLGEVVSWTLSSLEPGVTAEVTFTVTATQTITNSDYRVEAEGGFGANGEASIPTQVTSVPVPLLTLSKEGPATALVGQLIPYTLTLTNSGTATATNLVITDTLPAGANYISGGLRAGNVISWTLDSLGLGDTAKVTFTVTATHSITNSSYGVKTEDGFGVVGSPSIFTLVTFAPKPILAISKHAPATTAAGQPITYTLTLTNSGTITATNLVITDIVPVGASYLKGGVKIGQVVNWTTPGLKPGATIVVTFVVTATQPVTNSLYGARADGGYKVAGFIPVVTWVKGNIREQKFLYLPVVVK